MNKDDDYNRVSSSGNQVNYSDGSDFEEDEDSGSEIDYDKFEMRYYNELE
jgi:hypothetical protein